MRLTIVAAALAAASLSFAFSPAFAQQADGAPGSPGHNTRGDMLSQPLDLGVDISNAGDTPAEVQEFLVSLHPDTRRLVLDGCQHVLRDPAQAQQPEETIPFCESAL